VIAPGFSLQAFGRAVAVGCQAPAEDSVCKLTGYSKGAKCALEIFTTACEQVEYSSQQLITSQDKRVIVRGRRWQAA